MKEWDDWEYSRRGCVVRTMLGFKIFEVQFYLILKEASFTNPILSPNSQSSLSRKTALTSQMQTWSSILQPPKQFLSLDYLHLVPGVFTPPSMSTAVTRAAVIASDLFPWYSSQMGIVKAVPGSCLKALWLFPCAFTWKPKLLTRLKGWCAPCFPPSLVPPSLQ